jgi:hypothetical protein
MFKLAHNKGFPYYGYVNVTLTLDDKLVKEIRKIAVERDTTLTGLVRAYLQELAAQEANSAKVRQDQQRFLETVERLKFPMGKRTWKREDLYVRGRDHERS